MPDSSPLKRVAFSPGEFAELFGKSQTWGYRQIYAGKVTTITEHGRILIPAKEVERVLEGAGIYNGKEKPKQAKARHEKLTPEQKSILKRFVDGKDASPPKSEKKPSKKRTHAGPKTTAKTENSGRKRVAKLWAGKPAER